MSDSIRPISRKVALPGGWSTCAAPVAAAGPKRTCAGGAAGADGPFQGEAFAAPGTYLSVRATVAADAVRVLHATGHDFVYVNGVLRPGDPYGTGALRLPVKLVKGEN